jgi:cytochrome c-type biogenesis protein CcmH
MTVHRLRHALPVSRLPIPGSELLGVLVLAAGLLGAATAAAQPALTAEQEATARRVEEQLMAPCCFGGTVATHHSPAAEKIRQDVRARVAQGATEQQILDAYLETYGERILAQPVARGFNLLAYWMPAVGLLCGTAVLVLWLRRHRGRRDDAGGLAHRDHPSDATTQRLRHRLEEELKAFDA